MISLFCELLLLLTGFSSCWRRVTLPERAAKWKIVSPFVSACELRRIQSSIVLVSVKKVFLLYRISSKAVENEFCFTTSSSGVFALSDCIKVSTPLNDNSFIRQSQLLFNEARKSGVNLREVALFPSSAVLFSMKKLKNETSLERERRCTGVNELLSVLSTSLFRSSIKGEASVSSLFAIVRCNGSV